MEPKVNYTLVGLFVVRLGAAILIVVLWLGKSGYRGRYERYYAYTRDSVSGLSVNAAVKYRGVEVGRVKEIILNPDNPEQVRLTLDIAQGTPIKDDTVALLDMQGLTGLATVNLTGGSRNSPPLKSQPGQEYPVIKTGPSFLVRLDQAGTRLITNLTSITEDLRHVMDDQNQAALRQILGDLAKVTESLAARRDRLNEGITSASHAMENMAQITDKMNEQLPALIKSLDSSAGGLQEMSKEVTRTSATMNGFLNQAQPQIEQFTGQTLVQAGNLVGELRQLTATIQKVASQLEREPNSLIFGRVAPRKGPGE